MQIKSWHLAFWGLAGILVMLWPSFVTILEGRAECGSWDCKESSVELNFYGLLSSFFLMSCITPVLFLGIKKGDNRSTTSVAWLLISFISATLLAGGFIAAFFLPVAIILSLLIVFFDDHRQMIGGVLSVIVGLFLLAFTAMMRRGVSGELDLVSLAMTVLAIVASALYILAGIICFLKENKASKTDATPK